MAKYPEGTGWFDYPGAADYLHKKTPGGFTERGVRKARARGDLPVVTIRGKVWIRKEDLDALFDKITRPQSSKATS